MALRILQAGIEPLGQFDGYDSNANSWLGGEVASFIAVPVPWGDKYAGPLDGYVPTAPAYRPAVTKTLASGMRPLFLADEGILNYGTLFGSLIGGTTGQIGNAPNTGTALGPQTNFASGKVTVWDKPGLYAVTLDAVDTTASTGLVVANTTIAVGSKLYATAAGLLTPVGGSSFEGNGTTTSPVVARFVEFSTNGS